MRKTPVCKVCRDAGKQEKVWNSHWVRDRPGGKVICPTLLNQECRYCHKLGHTPSFCPILIAQKDNIPTNFTFVVTPKPKKPNWATLANGFPSPSCEAYAAAPPCEAYADTPSPILSSSPSIQERIREIWPKRTLWGDMSDSD